MYSNVLPPRAHVPPPLVNAGVAPGRTRALHNAAAVTAAAKNKFTTLSRVNRLENAVGNMHAQVNETQHVVNKHTNCLNAHGNRLDKHDQMLKDLAQKVENHENGTWDSINGRWIKDELRKRGRDSIDKTTADDLLRSKRFKSLRGLKQVASRANIPYDKDF